MNDEVQRKLRHVAGPIVFCGTIQSKCERPGIPNGARSAVLGCTSSAGEFCTDAAQIFHKASLLEKRNLESDIEFLPRPCRWGLFQTDSWLRLRPASLAPLLTGTNRCVREGAPSLSSPPIFRPSHDSKIQRRSVRTAIRMAETHQGRLRDL